MKKSLIKMSVILLAASSMLLLNACSKKPTAGSEGASDAGSQTYGMNSNGTDSDGFKINSLKAPSNQTYYFGFDKSDLRSQDMKALLIQANYIASHASRRK